jgi:uncharacterized protein YkwD
VRRLAALAVLLVLLGAQPARGVTKPSQRLFGWTNAARANVGLSPLRVGWRLKKLARQHSREMAAAGYIYHSSMIYAENVGQTPVGELRALFDAFMRSAPHRANILGPYTRCGIGVIRSGGYFWVTVLFR